MAGFNHAPGAYANVTASGGRVGHAFPVTDKVLGSAEFFGLVDEFLSPRMAELGYHRIGGFENDQPRSRGMLTGSATPSRAVGRRVQGALLATLRTLRRLARADSAGSAPFLLYDFGFEAGSDDVRQLVDPEDPDTADELWLSYEPATGELDLRAWDSVAEGRVDWDPRLNTGLCSGSEVRRRLADLGRAVADVARSQTDPPPTP